MEDIKKTFKKYDKDGNGYISHREAHEVLHTELGFDLENTKRLIKVYDRNGDGKLSYEEFIWFFWKIQEKKESLAMMFQKFDQDGNKCISFDEAKQVLKDLNFSDAEIKNLIDLHDTNKDGLLQYDEFVHFWNSCGGKLPTIP